MPPGEGMRELQSLHSIALRIMRGLELSTVLPDITKTAVELLGATAGVLVLWDEERQEYHDMTAVNLPPEVKLEPVPKSDNTSIGAYTVEHGEPVVLDDYAGDPRSQPSFRSCGFKATVSVPLLGKRGAIGALIVFTTDHERKFGGREVDLLSAFADQATIAIENALLYEREKERHHQIVVAQEQERRKIARELHDEICQSLLNLLMDSALREREADRPELVDFFREHTASLRQVLESTRGMLADLRNITLETLGLVGAIEAELLPRWRRRTSCEVTFTHRDWPDDLSPDASLQIYRVLQEALTNVKKHAFANRVELRLERRRDLLLLAVSDDGVGFDPAEEAGRSDVALRVGIEGMRERAGLLNARLSVESRLSKGTTLSLEVPYVDAIRRAPKEDPSLIGQA